MANTSEEWMRQAEYDIATAQAMFDARRYFYTAFMCHLSVEKALKAVYMARRKQVPPKTHNLAFLTQNLQLSVTKERSDFLFMLNRMSVMTRYPEDMDKLIREFPKTRTRQFLRQARETVRWLKKELPKS
ncbi:MAG: HEPN domain-containing protein [Candidatus Brocadiia bacterium]|jgi:HEPN domain-containing protein